MQMKMPGKPEPAPKGFKENVKSWFTNETKRKFLINVALFGTGVFISSAFCDLTFEAPAPVAPSSPY